MQPIGIDLGTSTSEIAVFRAGSPFVIPDPTSKSPIVPSIVGIDKRGNILAGSDALGHVDVPGRGIREVKRKMGNDERLKLGPHSLRPEEVSAHILKRLVRNAEEALGQTIKEVVVTVPAQFAEAARAATSTAAELAGLKVLRLIQEPTAAAMAYGVTRLNSDERIVVFDFGGGTLDISVLEMMEGILDVKASHGDRELGGKDIDDCLQKHFLETFQKLHPSAVVSETSRWHLKPFAEGVKRHLSTNPSYSGSLHGFGISNGMPIDLEVELTRNEFNRLLSGVLVRAKKCLEDALKRARVEPRSVDQVLLVGGTTYIPAVRELVADVFGKPSKVTVEPDLAVAMGACVQAAIIAGEIDSDSGGLIVTDVSPFGLGISIVGERGGQLMLVYEALMPPNTKIPYSVKRSYTLLHPDQRQCSFQLYQDGSGKAKLPEDAIDTGVVGELTDIPPALYGSPHPVEVEFSYDLNGRAQLRASIPGMGKSLEIAYERAGNYMSKDDLKAAKERLEDPAVNSPAATAKWRAHPKASEFVSLIEKAETKARELGADRASQLIAALARLKLALEQNHTQQLADLESKLIDLLFEFEG